MAKIVGRDYLAALSRAPKAILEQNVEWLELSKRAHHRLASAGIVKVEQLLGIKPDTLLRIDGFGAKCLAELVQAIEQATIFHFSKEPCDVSNGSLVSLNEVAGVDGGGAEGLIGDVGRHEGFRLVADGELARHPATVVPLQKTIAEWLASLDVRSAEVIRARAGGGVAQETLEALGERFNVTRERIRQIEARAFQKFRAIDQTVAKRINEALDEIRESRTGPVFLSGVPAESSYFDGLKNAERWLTFLIQGLGDCEFRLIKMHGRQVASRLASEEWDDVVRLARDLVKRSVARTPVRSDLQRAVETLLGPNCVELKDELWQRVSEHAVFGNLPGEREPRLVAVGRSVEAYTIRVLEETEEPLHYRDVHQRCQMALADADIRRVHSALADVGLLLGRGVYGLRKHIPVSNSEAQVIAHECQDIIEEGPDGRQWHSSELLSEIEQIPGLADRISSYQLSALLQVHSSLKYMGRQIWVINDGSRRKEHARLDVMNAVVAVLEEARRPMTPIEIFTELKTIRGMGEIFQIHPRGRLVKVSRDQYGLGDRDVSISHHDMRSFLENLEEHLHRSQRAVHVSEITAVLALVDKPDDFAWQVYGHCQIDERFSTKVGDFVCLSGWNSTNRKSVYEAALSVRHLLISGAPIEEVTSRVAQELDRPVSADQARAAIKAIGAKFDAGKRLWVLDDIAEEDSESG
ncbi:MAG: hypothetical protein IPO08_09410 [Xanthomonadales bacterium]|nr:hypothetical protein [Xanthomonadales bacterium]